MIYFKKIFLFFVLIKKNFLIQTIKDTINTRWPNIKFLEQVLIILTVPAEFTDSAKAIMRDCVFQAGLIATKSSEKLQFSTERKLLLSKKFIRIRDDFISKIVY